jgi:hypothetical protein
MKVCQTFQFTGRNSAQLDSSKLKFIYVLTLKFQCLIHAELLLYVSKCSKFVTLRITNTHEVYSVLSKETFIGVQK